MGQSRIERIAVIGAGLMGHGIAQEFALAGHELRLHDLSEERLQSALGGIRANLSRLAELGRCDAARINQAVAAIHTSTDLPWTVSGADLIVEAIFEDLDAKHALLRSLGGLCESHAILASNTSSFMPSRLAEAVPCPDRLLVAHYFNPPYLLPLVEIVPGPETSEETVSRVEELLRRIGKMPVVLKQEATGFVGNRLQFALFREALAIVAEGIADPEAVDQVVKSGFGRRLAAAGPFEVFDLGGLDTIMAVAEQIFPVLTGPDRSAAPIPELLAAKVRAGDLGVKTGRGFHEWTPEQAEELRQRLTRALLQFAPAG